MYGQRDLWYIKEDLLASRGENNKSKRIDDEINDMETVRNEIAFPDFVLSRHGVKRISTLFTINTLHK